ncbi:MAG: CDP-glycerol glycerophosphotransferase family protein [Rhizobiaceae bacterium]|nr:CDP-glycerol glycerophosphotransferase family protein [Rhizobiaceae bacterium]
MSEAIYRRINFVFDETVNYKDLQDQSEQLISQALLGTAPISATRFEADPSSINIAFFIRLPGNVFLSHSIADRNYTRTRADGAPCLPRFQTVLVPGEWARRRVLEDFSDHFSPDRVVAVGHPRIDFLRRLKVSRESRIAPEDRRLKVLFAPAHSKHGGPKGASVSSYPKFLEFAEAVAERFDLQIRPHPRDRDDDKTAIGSELVDCDVVVSDASSMIYEAWALGKPVIFPRWIVGDGVIDRFRGSAEAHIFENRIGYHPDSFDEFLEVLESGPTIGDDVDTFMEEYLANYREGDSAEMIAAELLKLGDENVIRRKEELDRFVDAAIKAVPKQKAIAAPNEAPRASMQLIQRALLDCEHDFLSQVVVRFSSNGTPSLRFSTDMLIMEIESALAQGRLDRARPLINRLSTMNGAAAAYFNARVQFLGGDALAALTTLLPALPSLNSYAAWRLVPLTLASLGRVDDAFSILERLAKQYKGTELLRDAQALVNAPYLWPRFQKMIVAGSATLPPWEAKWLSTKAMAAAGETELALKNARSVSKEAAVHEPGWLVDVVQKGWGPSTDLPIWLVPVESLALNLSQAEARRSEMLSQICKVVLREKLPFFLSRGTMKDFLAGNLSGPAAHPIELGIRNTSKTVGACQQLAEAALLESIASESTADRLLFRSLNGTLVAVQMYHEIQGQGLEIRDSGVATEIPRFRIGVEVRNGLKAPVPSDTQAYADAVFGGGGLFDYRSLPYCCGKDREVFDEQAMWLRLHMDFIAARATNDETGANVIAGYAKRMGDPTLAIHLAKLQKAFEPSTLPEKLEQARYLIHIGDGVEADFHVDLWYQFVKNADPNALLVIRSPQLFTNLKTRRNDLDIVYIKTGIEAEWLVNNCPKLVGVLYISNTGNTVHFLRFNQLTHIWVGHGDSEKAASCHKFFRAYDEVWCAGMAQIDRFRNSRMDHASVRFRIVGRPTLRSLIETAAGAGTFGRFLYLPTWEGFQAEQEYTSIRFAEKFVPSIAELTGSHAVVKFHPWVGKRLAEFNKIERRLADTPPSERISVEVADRRRPVVELMTQSDFLVTDISSVISDYLALGKPIFVYLPPGNGYRTTNSSLSFDQYCYSFRDSDELRELVSRVIVNGDDYLREARLNAREYFLNTKITLENGFEGELQNLIAEHELAASRWTVAAPISDSTSVPKASQIIAHRGAKDAKPENSIAGFEVAASLPGIDGVELDVHQTSDRQLVVMHDPLVDRTTTGSGPISNFDLEGIRRLSLKETKGGTTEVLDAKIPTLDEALDALDGTFDIYLELKTDVLGNAYPGQAEAVLDLVRRRKLRDRIVLSCFAPMVLEQLRYLDPDIRLLASVNARSVEMLGGIDRTISVFDHIPRCAVTLDRKLIRAMKEQRPDFDYRRFGIWVVNTAEELRSAISEGHRQIFTDRPSAALEIRAEYLQV